MEGAGGGRPAAAFADGGQAADRHRGAAHDRGSTGTLEARRGGGLLWGVTRLRRGRR